MYLIYIQIKMKLISNISLIIVSLSLLLGCSGKVDDSAVPVLTALDTQIDLATESQVVFSVTYNGQDVTTQSKIYTTSSVELEGNVYFPTAVGEYCFVAEYAGKQSDPLVITVVDSTPPHIESVYDRHVCVIEFTGAWCINCPEGYDKIKGILAYPQLADYKENVHICALHSDLEGEDTLAIAATRDVMKLFKDLAFPAYSIDLRVAGVLTDESASDFRPGIISSFTDYMPHCGVSVASVINADRTEASVTVKLTSEMNAQYRVVVFVVQDRIAGYQKTPTYPNGQDDYTHHHVVRKVVNTYSGTFTGEKLTEDGYVQAGNEVSKTWTIELENNWVLENTEIYALALDADGYVNNMNICPINGGDSGYDFK